MENLYAIKTAVKGQIMAETMHEKMMKLHGAGDGRNNKARKLQSYEITLKSKRQIAKNTYAFVFEKPKGFQFKAGQHIRLTLLDPPETDDKGNSRFFSVASSPKQNNLEIAMRMTDTAFKRVIGTMPIGSKVFIQMMIHSHKGSFTLHDDTTKPAVFLVGGIGIAPAYSIIKDTVERNSSHKIYLFYSNRRPEDAPYLNELKALARQHPTFKLIATMTEPEKSAKTWRGETGRINQAMLKRSITNLQTPIYYIAGLTDMVTAMKKLLASVDVKHDNIRVEEFAGFMMNHNDNATPHKSKSKTGLILIGLAMVAMIAVHGAAGLAIFKSGQASDLLKNPLLYLMFGLMIGGAVMLKLKLLSAFRRGKNNV